MFSTRGDSCTASDRNDRANVDVVSDTEPMPNASRAMTPSTASVIGTRSAGRAETTGASATGRSSMTVLMRSLP